MIAVVDAGTGNLRSVEKALQAVCAPSRNALLTGLRPQSLGIYELSTNFRKGSPDAVTHGGRSPEKRRELGRADRWTMPTAMAPDLSGSNSGM